MKLEYTSSAQGDIVSHHAGLFQTFGAIFERIDADGAEDWRRNRAKGQG